jgi:hypothetical protein
MTNALAETAEKKRVSVRPSEVKPPPAKEAFAASLKSEKSDHPMESDDRKMTSPAAESERTTVAKKLGRMDMNAHEESKVAS